MNGYSPLHRWCFHGGEEERSTPHGAICDTFIWNRIAALEDGAEKLYISAAASLSHHPSVANYFTVDLAVLKEMAQELAELFGLRLPVPFKCQVAFTT